MYPASRPGRRDRFPCLRHDDFSLSMFEQRALAQHFSTLPSEQAKTAYPSKEKISRAAKLFGRRRSPYSSTTHFGAH
jgi:hypothetical protein